ncbi:MAG: nuclear transport factor 2 family protein [Gammaproteobacteria bacterium]|nr:nuclear transport factor 2 family protein [Gammaproteobacteria bacterium]
MPDGAEVVTPESAADITAVSQLILRERESRDMCYWNRMRDCFHPDSVVNISWFKGNGYDFVAGSRDMFERGTCAKHRLGPVLVTLNGKRAVATLSAIIDIPMALEGVDVILSAHCLMVYRAEQRDGIWRIFGFEAIYRRDEFTPAVIGNTPNIDPAALKPYRASYRNLCYSLALNGFTPSNDLPGEDRPELANALLQEVYGWAGLDVPT